MPGTPCWSAAQHAHREEDRQLEAGLAGLPVAGGQADARRGRREGDPGRVLDPGGRHDAHQHRAPRWEGARRVPLASTVATAWSLGAPARVVGWRAGRWPTNASSPKVKSSPRGGSPSPRGERRSEVISVPGPTYCRGMAGATETSSVTDDLAVAREEQPGAGPQLQREIEDLAAGQDGTLSRNDSWLESAGKRNMLSSTCSPEDRASRSRTRSTANVERAPRQRRRQHRLHRQLSHPRGPRVARGVAATGRRPGPEPEGGGHHVARQEVACAQRRPLFREI